MISIEISRAIVDAISSDQSNIESMVQMSWFRFDRSVSVAVMYTTGLMVALVISL